jgi:rare lipoprotein A (peptidoglycan hydrolase)
VLERPVHAGFAIVAGFALVALAAASGCSHRVVAKAPVPAKIGATESGVASWYGVPYHGRRTASGEIYDMEQLTAAHRTLPFQTWLEITDLDNGKRVSVRVTDRGPFVDGRVIDLSLAAARKIEMVGPGIARVKLKVIAPPHGLEKRAGQKTEKAAGTPPPMTRPAPVSAQTPDTSQPPRDDGPDVLPRPSSPTRSDRPPTDGTATRAEAGRSYAVQAAAFADRDRAEAFLLSIRAQFGELIVEARVIAAPPGWKVLLGRQMTLDDANQLAAKVRAAGGQALVVADRGSQP